MEKFGSLLASVYCHYNYMVYGLEVEEICERLIVSGERTNFWLTMVTEFQEDIMETYMTSVGHMCEECEKIIC